MADPNIPANLLSITAITWKTTEPGVLPRPSTAARLAARFRAGRLDRLVAVGVPARAGSAQSAHEWRLMSTAEREAIARSLRTSVANAGGVGLSSRIPLHGPNIAAAADVIDAVTSRLHSPLPVRARGMARLRLVLSDGTGPLYRCGRGDLRGRLGAALAAL